MEYIKIKDVNLQGNIGERVFVKFMARDVDVRTQKDGVTKYLVLNMCDRDFKIDAKKFGASEDEINTMKNGYVYRAAVDIKEYAKSPTGYSCIIYNFEVATDENASSYIEWTDGIEHAYNIVQSTLNEIGESIYKDLVCPLIVDNWSKFSIWTGASSWHHYAMGGLLVHSAEVVELADVMATFWEERYGPGFINRPLLLSAALIHDLGKVKELNVDTCSGSTEYSKDAALESHITICISMINEQAYNIGFGMQKYIQDDFGENIPTKSDEQLESEVEALKLLKHCVLAHHGKLEYGSPIAPHVPEASIIHSADSISAEMFRYNKTFETLDSGSVETIWHAGQMVVTYKDTTKS